MAGCYPSPHDLIARNEIDGLRQALLADPDLTEARDRLEKTPLHTAVSYKRMDAIEALLDAGANLDAADVTGMTPLHVAAMLGRREELQRLLDAGGAPTQTDAFGDTPTHTAAVFGAGGSIQVLHRTGAHSTPPTPRASPRRTSRRDTATTGL